MQTPLSALDRLRTVPLLPVLAAMVAGVVVGTVARPPIWAAAGAAIVCGAMAMWRRGEWIGLLYTALTVMFFGAAIAHLHLPQPTVSQGDRIWMEVRISENPTPRPGRRSASTQGVIERWHDGQRWIQARDRVQLGIDTTWLSATTTASDTLLTRILQAGDLVRFRGYVNPLDGQFGRLMRARGMVGRTWISRYSQPQIVDNQRTSWPKRLQNEAAKRLQKLNDSGIVSDEIAIAAAMTTGNRSALSDELRRAYSRTGAAHLLAVSGLHVGIIFVIINVLLLPLAFIRRGHIAKNVIAVAAIWLYAAMTGASPSATRAAWMFTGSQIALAMSQSRNSTNIMCATAIIMITVAPGMIFDISFQLSFIAVAAILSWFSPLYALVSSRWWLLNALWSALIIGLVASTATLPLVSHTFGVFSPAGIVLNPLVITTSHLILLASIAWISMPFPALESTFRWLVGGPGWIQNRAVEMVSQVPGATIEWSMPAWGVALSYGAMIALTALFHLRRRPSQLEQMVVDLPR